MRKQFRGPWTYYGLVFVGMLLVHHFHAPEGTSFMAGWCAAYFLWSMLTPPSLKGEKEGGE